MNKEEALINGMDIHETKHSMKRRCPWHDYRRVGTYMLTLVVGDRQPLLGRLVGDSPEEAHVELTALGKAIRDEEIRGISRHYPQVEVWKLCIMPDHLHIILHISEEMAKGKHLGFVVRGFKGGCSRAWWRLNGTCVKTQGTVTAVTVPSVSTEAKQATEAKPTETKQATEAKQATAAARQGANEKESLFEAGYNDKILFEDEQLDNWKAYLDDNPRRLWLKRRNPQFFTAIYDFLLADRRCQIIGNRFLLDIPDKRAVIVHRRYTDEERRPLPTSP